MLENNADKSIVHLLCSFSLSGAHIFAVNLANEQAKNYRVTLLSMDPRFNDAVLTNRIHPNVKVINLKISRLIRGGAYKIGHWFSGMAQNNPLFVCLMAWKLKKILRHTDIVHTHLVRDQFIVSKALNLLGQSAPKHIITDHGGFLSVESSLIKYQRHRRTYSKNVFKTIFNNCAHIVTLSDTQNAFWKRKTEEGYPVSYRKIYNGNPLSEPLQAKSRTDMGYAEDDFIFVMVARGDQPSKGWELTIRAFLKNDDSKARLMLIGEGREITRLKAIHGNISTIRFLGLVQDPFVFLQIADVGVLASTYVSESLPNSIIEYLQAGKPVIGSEIGDIKNMLQIGKEDAGILLPIKDNKIDVTAYADAMHQMQHDKVAYERFKNNAVWAGKQFDMSHCADRYSREVYSF